MRKREEQSLKGRGAKRDEHENLSNILIFTETARILVKCGVIIEGKQIFFSSLCFRLTDYISKLLRVYVYVYFHVCICIYACTPVCLCTRLCICARMYVHVYVCKCA